MDKEKKYFDPKILNNNFMVFGPPADQDNKNKGDDGLGYDMWFRPNYVKAHYPDYYYKHLGELSMYPHFRMIMMNEMNQMNMMNPMNKI